MAQKALKTGDKAPTFQLKDQNGNLVDIGSFIGQHILVIYFYPKDDTPGCTKEACTFRDSYEEFELAGAKVFGISSDSPSSHKRFAEKHGLNFTLLSDVSGRVEKMFGVPRNFLGLLPGRVTYVIDMEGIIRLAFNAQFQAQQHIDEALKVVRQLAGEK